MSREGCIIVILYLTLFQKASTNVPRGMYHCYFVFDTVTKGKYKCPEMDVDFGGSDITVITDVLNWEECGEESFSHSLSGDLPGHYYYYYYISAATCLDIIT